MDIPIGSDNAFFLDLYARYRRDRNSVPADWIVHFEALDGADGSPGLSSGERIEVILADAYRRFGHLESRLDPLSVNRFEHPKLADLRSRVEKTSDRPVAEWFDDGAGAVTLGRWETMLRGAYAGHIAVEAEHLIDDEAREWLYSAYERDCSTAQDNDSVQSMLESVLMADEFESFMRVKFPSKKRFGSEGSESAVAFLREVLRLAAEANTSDAVIGGMHRGRLATLAVALGKSPAVLAGELKGRDLSDDPGLTGDVPYHLGLSSTLEFGARSLKATLMPHPSHLMVVAPVALGCARATASKAEGETLAFLMHTDAAFSGQGLAAELLQIGGLPGYSAGGAIHLVVNNQIGFTTLPSEGRSSRYCTDIAKTVAAPVFHVNADDPLAVARVARLAVAWWARYRKDIVIDLVCYRRFGHNELDEPRFTQPETWNAIDHHPTLRESFVARAREDWPNILRKVEENVAAFRERLREGFELADHASVNDVSVQGADWAPLVARQEAQLLEPVETGVELERLAEIGIAASRIAEGIAANPKVQRFYEKRAATIEAGSEINFATAETLAFATLLSENVRLRLSGQDAVRGTFTQRHLVVHDMNDGRTCMPLAQAAPEPGRAEMINSPLSEYGVLGFEYGHSLVDPNCLTMWEAQFGDFLNGAQIVVDQYIASAESKWQIKSGLVLMLPHGLEGQGPDHSSARIERLAQLYASGNILIAQPTSPANLFHLLRRQIVAPWRKPLFLIAPKVLLRAKAAISDLAEMGAGTRFRPVIVTYEGEPEHVRRVIICSGKIFYALDQARRAEGREGEIALVRIEQIAPFPAAELAEALAPFTAAERVWCQEEAENQGAWPFVRPYLEQTGTSRVVARATMAVCAGGSVERHERENELILSRALACDAPKVAAATG